MEKTEASPQKQGGRLVECKTTRQIRAIGTLGTKPALVVGLLLVEGKGTMKRGERHSGVLTCGGLGGTRRRRV
jgi:hypothetical protein